MTDMLERAFLNEVVRQCVFADLAAEDLNVWTHPDNIGKMEGIDRVWYSVQGLLISLGNLSKLLWPHEVKKSEGLNAAQRALNDARRLRRNRLRQVLEVPENSPLRSVHLRNIFEHVDLEIEQRFKNHPEAGPYPDSCVMPIDLFLGFDPTHFARNLDPDRWTLTFQDKSPLALGEALTEVARVYAKAIELLSIPVPPSP